MLSPFPGNILKERNWSCNSFDRFIHLSRKNVNGGALLTCSSGGHRRKGNMTGEVVNLREEPPLCCLTGQQN